MQHRLRRLTVNVDDAYELEEGDNEQRVAGRVDVHDVEQVEAALGDHGQTEQEETAAQQDATHRRSTALAQHRELVDERRHDALCRRKLQ